MVLHLLLLQVETGLQQFKSANGITWQTKEYEAKCAEWLKSHQDWGETFPEWRLYESARSVHTLLNKKGAAVSGMLDDFRRHMEAHCDFLSPRLNASVALQNIHYVLNTVAVSLYDGIVPQARLPLALPATH